MPRRTESGARRAALGNEHQHLVVGGIGAGFEGIYCGGYFVAEGCGIRASAPTGYSAIRRPS